MGKGERYLSLTVENLNKDRLLELSLRSPMIRMIEKLRKGIEKGMEINPEDFRLEITSFEEEMATVPLYKLLTEKMKTLQEEEKVLYEEARKNIIKACMEYELREFENIMQEHYGYLAKYSWRGEII